MNNAMNSLAVFNQIILRAEYRKESRTPLVPCDAQKIIENGITVYVEKSDDRVFTDEEYKKVGCVIIEKHDWTKYANCYTLIVGLKELPLDIDYGNGNNFVHFQHCLKQQKDSATVLCKMKTNELFDFEYFVNNGRRLLAFGHDAGFVGAGLAMLKWICIMNNLDYFSFYKNIYTKREMIDQLNELMTCCKPKIMIIGANGRCGTGALELLTNVGVGSDNITKWDIEQTKTCGPYKEILEHDILINTILLNNATRNTFLTNDFINQNNNKKLKIIIDVSCDVTSTNNVLPLYTDVTTLENPFVTIVDDIELCAVDNLPSLIPKDASICFSNLFAELIINKENYIEIWCDSLHEFHDQLIETLLRKNE
jgi:saccharopine dehydrogenase (NAD+, L-lysine-forming)